MSNLRGTGCVLEQIVNALLHITYVCTDFIDAIYVLQYFCEVERYWFASLVYASTLVQSP